MGHDVRIRFGNRLREMRKRREISQEEMGARAGLSRNFVSMIETGHRNVTLATVEKLAGALKCRMADLMPDAED